MTQPQKKGLLRSPWLRVAIVLLMLAAWGWFLYGQLDELRRYTWQIEPIFFGFGIIWGAIYFAGLGACWTLLLRTMGENAQRVPLRSGTYIWLSTMLSRYIPGNVWHIIGRLAFAERLGVTKSQILASATVEQLLTLLGALSVVGLSLPFWQGASSEQLWFIVLLPLGLILIHPKILGAMLQWVAVRLKRPDLAWSYRYQEILGVLCAFALTSVASGIAFILTLSQFTAVSINNYAFLIGIAAFSWVVGYLSILVPSGLGVREAMLTALLAQIYPLPIAIIASLVYRLVLTLGELCAVGLSLVYIRVSARSHSEEVSESGSSVT